MRHKSLAALIVIATLCPPAFSTTIKRQESEDNIVMTAMQKELDRSFAKLKTVGDPPLYFLAYRLYDTQTFNLTAEYGALNIDSNLKHNRQLSMDLRVGSPQLDNTHKIRDQNKLGLDSLRSISTSPIPIEDNELAIRAAIWIKTDNAFKNAQKRYAIVKTNQAVKATEEDKPDDFSLEKPCLYTGKPIDMPVDRQAWEAQLRRLSAIYRHYPDILDSRVHFVCTKTHRYMVTSEGTKVDDQTVHYGFSTTAESLADDGMKVWLFDGVETATPSELPSEEKFAEMVNKLAQSLEKLRKAPPAEPYTGPAILRAKAAGVYFHETFGHRIEGHRQKDLDQGRTFAKKLGQQVMPDFISVIDDPTAAKLNGKPLNGFYHIDDEGVPAQKVTLVDHGILKTFLMGRSPVKGCDHSNGHGRCSPGYPPTARQGNLMVVSSKSVPYEELRTQLIAEAKKQGKPYGLIFNEIAGGFTMTHTMMPQVFKLQPLMVTRVYIDDQKPDELIRGVDLVGTPLTSLEKILQSGTDVDTFNGTCGAESGWVPVSASSPSLLVQTIEVERKVNTQDKAPILPPPDAK